MKGALTNSRKKGEAQQLQIEVGDDASWKEALNKPGLLVVDVYSDWCGPCSSMTGHLRRIKMELGDDCLTLATAKADKITELEKFRGKAEPTFLFFGSGKPLCAIHGADGPNLLTTIREQLMIERSASKGKMERPRSTVLIESLVKPEEVIEPDEDLDDLEADILEKEEAENERIKTLEAVVLISPSVIANDRTEAFLSHIVSAGLLISGHIQKEMTKEELRSLLQVTPSSPPQRRRVKGEDNTEEEGNEREAKSDKGKEGKEGEEDARETSRRRSDAPVDKELEMWENELSRGPLYMLLLRSEEEHIFDVWNNVSGTLDSAKTDQPDTLMGQFGQEDMVAPAWMPQNAPLQQRLKQKFFPPPPDADLPRLLLLPDPEDHQQALEALCSGGLQVLAHTQVALTQETLASLNTTSSAENIQDYVGSQLLAAVVTGANAVSVSSELMSLHLTSSSESAIEEISVFFPDLAADLSHEPSPLEEPQTQMQIEQKRENSIT